MRGCYSFWPPLISETVWKFDVGSKLLPFYMTIDISYFLYISGDNGANILLSWAVNKMCSYLTNLFAVILGVGFCNPDPKI